MSIELKLDSLVSKHNELENILSNSHELEHNEYARLSREFVELKEIVEVINSYRKKKVELSDLEIMASDQEIDLDIKKLANDELKNTKSILKDPAACSLSAETSSRSSASFRISRFSCNH